MSRKTKADTENFDIVFIAGNTIFAFIITLIALLAAAEVFSVFSVPREITALTVKIITYICIGICAFKGARRKGNNGLVFGAFFGLLYVTILYFISSAVNGDFTISTSLLTGVLICVSCGALGGILGVNSSH